MVTRMKLNRHAIYGRVKISRDLNNKRFVFHKMVTAGSMGVNAGNQNWVPTDDVGNDTPRTNERGDNANAHINEQAGKQITVSTTLIGDQSGTLVTRMERRLIKVVTIYEGTVHNFASNDGKTIMVQPMNESVKQLQYLSTN
jgi:hypothetical protein